MRFLIEALCKREDLPPELVEEIDIPGCQPFDFLVAAPAEGVGAFIYSITPWTDLPLEEWHKFPDEKPEAGVYMIVTMPDEDGDRRLILFKFETAEDADRCVRLSGMERFGFKRIMMEKQRECQDEEDEE